MYIIRLAMKKCLPIQRSVHRDAYGDLARRDQSSQPSTYVPLNKRPRKASSNSLPEPVRVDCRPRRSLPAGPMASAIALYEEYQGLAESGHYQPDDTPVHIRR